MDVFSVYDAAKEAVNRARSGEGPTFLEIKTYRYHGHFHADDPKKYRKQEEEDYYKSRDCLILFEKKVIDSNLIKSEELKKLRDQIEDELVKATDFALSSPCLLYTSPSPRD